MKPLNRYIGKMFEYKKGNISDPDHVGTLIIDDKICIIKGWVGVNRQGKHTMRLEAEVVDRPEI